MSVRKRSIRNRHGRLQRLLSTLAATALVVVGLTVVGGATAPAAQALSGSQFDPGNIISDAVFFNSTTMGAGDVQSFLTSHGSNCRPGATPCLKDYSQATPTRAGTSYCQTYIGQGSETAAQIIARVGVACDINPQVLLVMLQKEQGLVDASATTSYMYRSAMGYGCPDTAACDSTYYGFFNQVYAAASQFQRYTLNSTSWSYQPGRTNNILFNPNPSCGSAPVFIQNQATANLYIYTPYQPNAAALANLGGIGDSCSAYGNRNFWVYFNNWFGSPTGGSLQSPSFEGGASGWGPADGFVNRVAYNDPKTAQSGSWFLASNTPVAGRTIAQDVQRPTAVGELATATMWVRSSDSSTFTGSLALLGLGGQTESASTPFSVTATWKKITVTLPVRQPGHTSVRLQVVMNTVGGTVYLDNATLAFAEGPPVKNLMSAPGFEGSFGTWGPGNDFVNRTYYNDPSTAHSGAWFGATNTSVPGRSLAQVIPVSPPVGSRYTFSIWLRSADASQTVSGRLCLWGLGGASAFSSNTDFVATGQWQKFTVTTDITQANVNALKPEVYLNTTNTTLFLDDASTSSNLLTAGSFEGGQFDNWGAGTGVINQAVYSSDATGIAAQNGSYFAATNTATAGSSVAQTVQRKTYTGDDYTAEVWVRSSDPAKPFSGTLALWALGGTTEVVSTDFTASGSWSLVRVNLPISKSGHTSLKFEIYERTVGTTLFFDAAQLY